MKYLKWMYIVMAVMVFVNLGSEYVLDGEYSAIASWLTTALFFFGTLFYINAKYYLTKK
ncbi:hypothetical protein ACQUWN_12645 [Rossellomorea aquimaris]|uniref:hypothetical protein n=1 Tax=Rossellomorea TaxID=2837508 RepID=UPI0016538457|nr:hypothetical protein [Rossellomorea vietnamensis]